MRGNNQNIYLSLSSLRREWVGVTLASGLYLLGGYLFLDSYWQPGSSNALRWLAWTSLALAYQLWVLWQNLSFNHRIGVSELLPNLGAGNLMTLGRGMLVAGLIGFLFAPWPEGWLVWVPAALYTLADAADYLDGYLARIHNQSTRLGEILDMSFDGVGVLAASLLGIQYGQLPAWYLIVGLARYIFLFGEWLRRRKGLPVYELPPNASRRAFAGAQMGFIAFTLWPIFGPPGTHIAAVIFATPFLAGFLRDWLIASGVIRPAEGKSGSLEKYVRWLPVLLRLTAAGLTIAVLLSQFEHWSAGLGTSNEVNLLLVLSFGQAVVALLTLAGAAGRIAAIAGLILLGIGQLYDGLGPVEVSLLGVYATLLFSGSGPYSSWKPEDLLIYHRTGEARIDV